MGKLNSDGQLLSNLWGELSCELRKAGKRVDCSLRARGSALNTDKTSGNQLGERALDRGTAERSASGRHSLMPPSLNKLALAPLGEGGVAFAASAEAYVDRDGIGSDKRRENINKFIVDPKPSFLSHIAKIDGIR
jgi:hypothetical protein